LDHAPVPSGSGGDRSLSKHRAVQSGLDLLSRGSGVRPPEFTFAWWKLFVQLANPRMRHRCDLEAFRAGHVLDGSAHNGLPNSTLNAAGSYPGAGGGDGARGCSR
ncbi:unnamed protein product, partial [Fusarium equiseti]